MNNKELMRTTFIGSMKVLEIVCLVIKWVAIVLTIFLSILAIGIGRK